MELVVMEFFLLVVVVIIVTSQQETTSLLGKHDADVVGVAGASIVYLFLAVLSHMHLREVVSFPPFFARLVTILHVITVPLFSFILLNNIERKILSKAVYSPLFHIQRTILFLFMVVSILDLFMGRLYIFSQEALFIGGPGIFVTLGVSILLVLVGLLLVFVRWRFIEWHERVVMVITALFLLFSLVFFEVFKESYMFSLSSAFLLFLHFLPWQRKELLSDRLTHIQNNQAFQESLKQATSMSQQKTIFMLDIENFRQLNERYGEKAGDAILKSFSQFLQLTYGDSSVYRVGGNRFILLFQRLTHNEIVRVVNVIKGATSEGCLVESGSVTFHVDIAIVEIPLKRNTPEEIIESLNFTMTEIKEKRRQPVIIFNQKLIGVRQRRLDVLSVLRKALVTHDMVKVYFQPIMDVQQNKPIAAEALMRLEDEQMGIISPGEFIPLAEQAGLISLFTGIMLQKVCDFLKEHSFLKDCLSHVSINISAADLSGGDDSGRLLEILDNIGNEAKMICFEITESKVLLNNAKVTKSWDAFREKGIRFFLDDFGTGYANLESLVRVPFDTVKIDRSLVSNSQNGYELLFLVSGMLQRLDKHIVAEGVETEAQLAVVRRAQIKHVQGFYYSKPLPSDQFLTWLEAFLS